MVFHNIEPIYNSDSKILILENEGHCSYAKKKYWYDKVKNFIKDIID